MIMTSRKAESNRSNLKEPSDTIRKYNLRMNLEKCLFVVKAGKFLGFLLTERGIEANPNKCATIISMQSSLNDKEAQLLTGRIETLSRFLLKGVDKGFPYFQCICKNKKFIWSNARMNVRD